MSTEVDDKTDILPEIEEEVSEPDGFAHYLRIKQILAGGPQVALCGKKFQPTTTIVHNKKVCPKCEELMAMLHLMYPVDKKDL